MVSKAPILAMEKIEHEDVSEIPNGKIRVGLKSRQELQGKERLTLKVICSFKRQLQRGSCLTVSGNRAYFKGLLTNNTKLRLIMPNL